MDESRPLLNEVPPEPYIPTNNELAALESSMYENHNCDSFNIDIDNDNGNDNDNENDNSDIFIPLHPISTNFLHEFMYLVKNSIPLFFTFFFQYLIQILIPTYFSSRLGSIYMTSSTLSMTTFYLTGPVLINGFTTSLDTLCSTAYGARHYHKVGNYYIQCIIILFIGMIPTIVFWLNCDFFFKFLTKNYNNSNDSNDLILSDLSSSFLSNLVYVLPAIIIFECTKRFLQSQTKFSIPTKIIIISTPVSILLNLFFESFLKNSDSKNLGPAYAFSLTYWLMTILLLLYTVFIDGYQCLPKNYFKHNKFVISYQNLKLFLNLGIPGILMILSEALAFQILTFFSTNFPPDQLAAQSILTTLASLAFQPPFAMGICCTTHLANLIGAKSLNFKITLKAIYLLVTILSVINFLWFFLLSKSIARNFTNDPIILETTYKLSKLIAINQFIDCYNIICAAILRGQGRQKIGSILSIVSYYLVGLPLEYFLGFKLKLEIYGLWIGLIVAVNCLSIVEVIIVLNSNWVEIIKNNNKMA